MRLRLGVFTLLFSFGCAAHAADAVEVLHRWTTPGEANAVNALKVELARQGITWVDMAIPGGDVDATNAVLRKRIMTKDPPTAAVMFHNDAEEWDKLGAMADLTRLAEREGWSTVMPPAVQSKAQVNGRWVAVPMNINVYNMLWASKPVLDAAGVRQLPTSWDAFIAAMDKVQATGRTGLAMSGKAWEIGIVFESVVLATGGPAFHRKAFRDRDRAALGSATMHQVFERMAQLRRYTDADYAKRDWSAASALLLQNKAAFQIMGAWAKGEFNKAGKVAGRDYMCNAAPGTAGTALITSDLLGMFNLSSGGFRRTGGREVQERFAAALMGARAQLAFNSAKGSLPARTDIPSSAFDACSRQNHADLQSASQAGQLLDPMTRVVGANQRAFILEIVARHFSGKLDSAQATEAMATVAD